MTENKSFKESHPLDDFISDKELSNTTIQKEKLTIEQQKQVDTISKQINPLDNEGLLAFGSDLQKQMSQFSHQMLDEVQSKDVGPIGDTLSDLMSKLKSVNPNELNTDKPSMLKRIFSRAKSSINEIFSRMQSVSAQVDRITIQLQKHQTHLTRDIELLDTLYDKNKQYFDDLSLHIIAAQQKKLQLENEKLPQLQQQAQQFIDRLDKRIYDLQLSRQIALQTAPQIRMIQNVNQALAEKIQSSILTSIPLWKNQMAIALTLMRQRNAVAAQRAVTDTTNDLLTANAEMLKQNAIETATENERGIVDLDTLKRTQRNIIETIEETLIIQQHGREERQLAEKELQQLEQDLKSHLVNIKGPNKQS
ncbi:toxic anion resistance protein [Staphylococcus aureus]|uniref:toxic anion resistance protein n=1 Tax=Staphylococcus aureus TaxID=1280 RepID=UPI00046482D6|nr:toxic anion resistance protein [Staphylococcus aureus]EIB2257583.1 toxic anion resistance protein [Staphylococcus aureus]MDG3084226.1 toxic anion resistance protein [Staphylococcus aureus]MDQ6389720.1 toxic anion resistance protein [Staphylococcus aureus]MDQ7165948.1 toxic anion resistance protein [Staphylococcus aureus]MDQ7941188.1 toxic anion resistance protein [Staphylococcus aureus]